MLIQNGEVSDLAFSKSLTICSDPFTLIAIRRANCGISLPFHFLITPLTNKLIDSSMNSASMGFNINFFACHFGLIFSHLILCV